MEDIWEIDEKLDKIFIIGIPNKKWDSNNRKLREK